MRLYDRRTGEPAGPETRRDRERLAAALDDYASRAAVADTPSPLLLSEELAEQLRALGYAVPEAEKP